jgi:hypothetical protein
VKRATVFIFVAGEQLPAVCFFASHPQSQSLICMINFSQNGLDTMWKFEWQSIWTSRSDGKQIPNSPSMIRIGGLWNMRP